LCHFSDKLKTVTKHTIEAELVKDGHKLEDANEYTVTERNFLHFFILVFVYPCPAKFSA
jgi:hypothetical protein